MNKRKICNKIFTIIMSFVILLTIFAVPDTHVFAKSQVKKLVLTQSKYETYVGKNIAIKVNKSKSAKAYRNAGVEYISSNKRIATVNSKGIVKPKKNGTVKITVVLKKNKKVKAACKVRIYKATNKIKLISKKSYTLKVGKKLRLRAKVISPQKGAMPITWSSSNQKVAKVDSKGNLVARQAGRATIFAKSGKKRVSVKIAVKKDDEENPVDPEEPETPAATNYTYRITPILPPFNEYFFIETDNPDPLSFRFADKSSKYSDDSQIDLCTVSISDNPTIYADINYENTQTGRVNGGYIFDSFDTDGGEFVLQTKDDSGSWVDTDIKFTIASLVDVSDYLISNYAVKSDFFDNMDAVQSGFSSICLYSGSYIRGELYKKVDFWSLSTSPHIDQSLYIQSPYGRRDNKSIFATAIYPFRYDSLGFPGILKSVAQRLDSTVTVAWNENYHYLIDITYNGQTRFYGGAGNGEGQGISQDQITQYFTFGANGTNISLENVRTLLNQYASVEMTDDVPTDGALTWESVCNTVGGGSWVSLTGIRNVFGSTGVAYTYLYRNGDGTSFYSDRMDNGSQMYYSGDLRYASDAWVDGRYIDAWENYVPGAKFEEHPTSDVIVKDVSVPQIEYERSYNVSSGKREYVIKNIIQKPQTILYEYSSADNKWEASGVKFDDGCANHMTLTNMVKEGAIDESYLDAFTLTQDEVTAMAPDRNTNIIPTGYYVYDGTMAPGTYYGN